jgi:ATP-dependent protease Clp ATPase subunit
MVPTTTVNTRNILFICGGAFPGLDEIVKNRLTKSFTMGFNSNLKTKYDEDPDLLAKTNMEDLREYGMIPEFIGRLPMIFALRGLDKEAMKRILTEPKNALIKQYEALLATEGVELLFTDEAIERMAFIAEDVNSHSDNIGARRLHTIMETVLEDLSFNADKHAGETITIDRDYVDERLNGIMQNQNLERYIL